MTSLERRIVAALAGARREGLIPKSLYLTPADYNELGHPEQVGGLEVRRVTGKGRSKVYCRHGIARAIAPPPRLAPRRRTLRSSPSNPAADEVPMMASETTTPARRRRPTRAELMAAADDPYLTRQEVEVETGLSRSAIYRRMLLPGDDPLHFPPPVRIGPNSVRWPRSGIEKWKAAQPQSRDLN